MVRILYGLAAEGMGHATRAKPILDELTKNNDVHILAGSRVFKYLSKHFRAVHRIFGFHIIYRNNTISNTGIFLYILLRLPLSVYSFFKVFFITLTYRPQLIITDFDPFTAIFKSLNDQEISKESVHAILQEHNPKKSIEKYKVLSDKDLERELKLIVSENKGLPFNALIGKAMSKLRGKAPGQKISEMLKKLA